MKRKLNGNTAASPFTMERVCRNNAPPVPKFFIYSCYLIIIVIPSATSYPVINSLSPHVLVGLPGRQWERQQVRSNDRLKIPALSYSHAQAQDVPDFFYSSTTSRLPIQSPQRLSSPPPAPPTTKPPPFSNTTKIPPTASTTTNTETKSSWLRWMTAGYAGNSQRDTSEIKMRDPIALGGLPRSERYAASDWLHNTLTLSNSAILKSIRGPVLSMTVWGTFIGTVHKWLLRHGRFRLARGMCVPTNPHSMMVSMLGLLLVFRTNSAYQRFAEGRKIWEDILNTARDLSRLAKLYEPQMGSARLRRIQRLLAAFPYMLRSRIRPSQNMKRVDDRDHVRDPEFSLILYPDHATSDSDADAAAVATDEETTGMSRRKTRELYWVDKRTLPWRLLPSLTKEECARAQNRPLWVCDRMAKELHSIPEADNFTARERLALLYKVEKLSQSIGACERIHQTVVPLNYARHALRSLTVWLLSLPFALVKDMGLMTGPILFVMSWMLFGVYEIGCSIEDPFQGALRLSILCDAIRRDVVGEEIIRNTAFELKDEAASNKEGVESKQNYLEDELDRYDDDDDDYEAKEDTYKIQIENIMIDSMGIPCVMPNVLQESESQKLF